MRVRAVKSAPANEAAIRRTPRDRREAAAALVW